MTTVSIYGVNYEVVPGGASVISSETEWTLRLETETGYEDFPATSYQKAQDAASEINGAEGGTVVIIDDL